MSDAPQHMIATILPCNDMAASTAFYERLGWRLWRGPSSVRTAAGLRATPDDDGYIMVLETPSSPTLDLAASMSCEFRPGDVW